jgi:acyl-CoA thioester hydrolase
MPGPFRHRLRVRWSECDLQGVVFYPQYLAYLDHTLTELWREAVGPYADVVAEHGADMLVAEAGMRYRASARFDDELEISATVTRLGSTSITTSFRIERPADAQLLTEGELRHVFIDPETFAKREIPPAVRAGLARFADESAAAPAEGAGAEA